MRTQTPVPFDAHQLEEFHRLYSLRAQVTGFAARMAAQRVKAGASGKDLRLCWETMRATARTNDYAAFLEADMLFHRTIVQLAATPALPETWSVLEEHFRAFAGWAQRALFRDLNMIAEAHRAQLETITAGDERAAEHAARVDLDALWQMLRERPVETTHEADPVERVRAYMILNLHRPLAFSVVAHDIAHLSPSHLSRLFQARYKHSFTAYLQKLRMERASHLLQEGETLVGDVATRCGYPDLSHFAAHFRRHFGCAPSDFRKSHDKHNDARIAA